MGRPKKENKKKLAYNCLERRQELREKYRYNRLILGMSRKASAIKAGYSFTTAVKQAYKIDRLAIKDVLGLGVPDALNISGMDDIEFAKALVAKTKATKIQNCRLLIRRDADGTPRVEQNADDFIEVDDNNTQMRALETIGNFKMKDRGQKTSPDGMTIGPNIEIIISLDERYKTNNPGADAAPMGCLSVTHQ